MSLRSRTLAAIASLLAVIFMFSSVSAGERWQRHRDHRGFHGSHGQGVKKVVLRPRVNVRQKVVINVDGRRRSIGVRATNTYSGDVDISYRPGVGTWSYGSIQGGAVVGFSTGSRAKIIDVRGGGNGCSMEGGVCVIRP